MTERPARGRTAHPALAIGVDIGGSGIKGAAVDLRTGLFATPRHRVKTPQPSSPLNVIPVVQHLVDTIRHDAGRADLPVGVTFPAPIIDGCTMSAANVDEAWIGYPAAKALANAVGLPVALVNDGDAAGMAEMRWGAGRGHHGAILLLTLGTGVGLGALRRRPARPEHGAGPRRDPREGRREAVRRGEPDDEAAHLAGVGRPPRRAHPRARPTPLARPDHPRRRREQERREVPPLPDRPSARSSWRP